MRKLQTGDQVVILSWGGNIPRKMLLHMGTVIKVTKKGNPVARFENGRVLTDYYGCFHWLPVNVRPKPKPIIIPDYLDLS